VILLHCVFFPILGASTAYATKHGLSGVFDAAATPNDINEFCIVLARSRLPLSSFHSSAFML
jgi:hypothetical protein